MGNSCVLGWRRVLLAASFWERNAVAIIHGAFAGDQHYLMVRAACKDEITCKKNLARNVYDRNQNKGMFPHAWANVETRNEAVFAARNAIDGVICPQSHGRYPYQSWGINRRPDAQWHLELGRPVQAESLVITTRADFPHDAWWVQATLQLSDGTQSHTIFKKIGRRPKFRSAWSGYHRAEPV